MMNLFRKKQDALFLAREAREEAGWAVARAQDAADAAERCLCVVERHDKDLRDVWLCLAALALCLLLFHRMIARRG